METKQTAVDFLKDKFIMIQWLLVRDEISRQKADEFLNEWTEQSKQMEKEQIKLAHRRGLSNSFSIRDTKAEQYYNETYGEDNG
jgi:hypothetical protein